jgi:hypothetical protein
MKEVEVYLSAFLRNRPVSARRPGPGIKAINWSIYADHNRLKLTTIVDLSVSSKRTFVSTARSTSPVIRDTHATSRMTEAPPAGYFGFTMMRDRGCCLSQFAFETSTTVRRFTPSEATANQAGQHA